MSSIFLKKCQWKNITANALGFYKQNNILSHVNKISQTHKSHERRGKIELSELETKS